MTAARLRWSALLLAVAVGASQLLLWWFAPDAEPKPINGPARSSYTLEDFSLDVLKRDGSVGIELRAPHLARRDADGSLFIDQPQFELAGADGARWMGQAEAGWVGANAEIFKLLGDVRMQRPATLQISAARIESADVTAWPMQQRLRSAAPTVIRQPGRILRGTGMKLDIAAHTMELLHDVQGTFEATR